MSDAQLFLIMFGVISLIIGCIAVFGKLAERRQTWPVVGYQRQAAAPAQQQRRTPDLAPRQPASPELAPTALPPIRPATLRTWWPAVLYHRGHLMIVGETQSGKSTTAFALLSARAQTDLVMVIDPHEKLNPWPLQAANSGRDFAQIDQLFQALDRELTRRYAPGEPAGAPLSIFIDEWPVIAAECPSAPKAFKRLVREGAKAGLRIVLLTQEASTKALGIEGEGPVRENLWRVLLGSFAAGVPGVSSERPAALERRGERVAVSVQGLDQVVQSVDPVRAWPINDEVAPQQTFAALQQGNIDTDDGCVSFAQTAVAPEEDTPDPLRNMTAYEVLARLLAADVLRGETKPLIALGVSPGSASKPYAVAKRLLDQAKREHDPAE